MRKFTLLMVFSLVYLVANADTNTGWFNDFLTIKVDGTETANNYYIGADPATGATALQGKVFGEVESLEITACDMKYWSDTQDRTGGSFFYKIMNSDNTVEIVPVTEIIWDQTGLGGNDYQGKKTVSVNLLTGLAYGMTYQLHVWAKSWGANGDSWLSNNSANYIASFTKKVPTSIAGTYKVGTTAGADFNSLSAAVNAINTNGLAGNVFLEISSDITETANIGLINTSDFTITIRPDADEPRTITFNKTTDNAGPSGAFCFGIKMGLAWTDLVPSKNLVIDGYAVGGSTRQLKIATAATHHGGNGPILLMDDCSNVQIINTIIHHVGSSTGSSNYGIYLRVNTLYGTKKMPSNVLIENNQITATQNTASQAIGIYAGTATTGITNGSNIVIKRNIITARTRGVFLYFVAGLEISDNEFHINQTADGVLSSAIMGNNGQTGDINIFNNRFIELKTANKLSGAYGMRAIIASGGGTWNIYNNFFTGFDKTNATTGETMMQAIRCGSTTIIRHNTFVLNSLSNKPSNIENPTETQGSYCAINIAAGSPVIENNILISNEDGCNNSLIRGGLITATVSDYNIMFLKAGNSKARFNATYATFNEYKSATGKDANSKSKEVFFASATDFSIVGTSINDPDLSAPAVATITTDIFGAARHTPLVYKGAHEASDLNISAPTKTFTVTVPDGTEKVYIAGTFIGKNWDITSPLELTATTTPNEFSGTFACLDDVEYKYTNGLTNWDYFEATAPGTILGFNRIYNAKDTVPHWFASPKVKLNVSFPDGSIVPSNLFVMGFFDNWITGIELSASSTPLFTQGKQLAPIPAVSYTVTVGDGTTSVIYSNTQYKFYTTDKADPNWEIITNNRLASYPLMNNEIASFTTPLSGTGVSPITEMSVRILRTPMGITAVFDGNAVVELYSINGALIDKTNATGSYSRELNHGAYIIRINGKATKFVK